MSIETYRQIVNERLAAIEKARKSVKRASNLISSTFLWSALEQLKLARLEVEADLRAHERVAAEKAAEQCVHTDPPSALVNAAGSENSAGG